MLSEYENNLIQQTAVGHTERKSRKSSIFKHWGQTFNSGRHGGHQKGCPELSRPMRELTAAAAHPLTVSSTGGSQAGQGPVHGSRRISHHQRLEPPSKMVQIHESSEAEGRV